NSKVETSGDNASAGIGGGWVDDGGAVANTTAVNSKVETSGKFAHAGIGVGLVSGEATVANTTAVNSTVETSGELAGAGIGVGAVFRQGKVANTTAVDSTVKTLSTDAHAGIGVGAVFHQGKVANTTAVNSTVETRGFKSNAGIGGGLVTDLGTVANTTAVNSYVIMKKDFGPESNEQLLCQKADPRVLTANCASGTEFLDDALDFSYGDVCPVNAATVPTTASASTAATESTAEAALAAATASSAATTAGITIGALVGLGIVGYSSYQWITGYRDGARGQELAMKPLTRGRELASAAVNSVSQGIQGTRERMNRQSVPAQEPAHKMSQVVTDRVTELDKRL
ncbi:hypothetical protein J7438_24430, partial [Thalassotalea sp. G20_0]|uniref:hypothetical protein n=1 Tax=Thalassotalea sp. G20_0 TaxID=2821093 RepID=UPI001ADB40F5